MITQYNPNIQEATHILRMTLLWHDYVGHISFAIDGNCKGASVLHEALDFFYEDYMDSVTDNDCQFDYDDVNDVYLLTLQNASGKTKCLCFDASEIATLLVKVEIESVEVET